MLLRQPACFTFFRNAVFHVYTSFQKVKLALHQHYNASAVNVKLILHLRFKFYGKAVGRGPEKAPDEAGSTGSTDRDADERRRIYETGWEPEREVFFRLQRTDREYQNGTEYSDERNESAAFQYGTGSEEENSSVRMDLSYGGDLVRGAVRLGRAVEQMMDDAPKYLDHNPAWRTYKYAGQKKEKKIADDETVKKLIQALESVSILYETYFKLIIATGMRRGECCALKWEDINYNEQSIHVCRNAVKTTGDEIIVKAPKTKAGNRYVYFSAEMESLLREYEAFCAAETERYDRRKQTKDDYVFRRKGMNLPMTPSTFTWRFKKILKANDLPTDLNVHSLRHTAVSLFIASGTDVGTVAGLLGHSQPSTTLDIYTHAFDKNKKAASQIMQSSLEI